MKDFLISNHSRSQYWVAWHILLFQDTRTATSNWVTTCKAQSNANSPSPVAKHHSQSLYFLMLILVWPKSQSRILLNRTFTTAPARPPAVLQTRWAQWMLLILHGNLLHNVEDPVSYFAMISFTDSPDSSLHCHRVCCNKRCQGMHPNFPPGDNSNLTY